MAKVIYFHDPLNKENKKEIDSNNFSIGEILKHLEIDKLQLSVSINGETPDECDLDYVPTKEDLIEIRRPLEGGGGNSQTKSDIATAVQIVAAIAVLAFDWSGTTSMAILIGGQVVSGVFNKWAMDLANKGPSALIGNQEADIASNSFSLSKSTNEVRPLSPMPIVMGTHRLAPDIYADAHRSCFNELFTISELSPLVTSYIPGIWSDNGAEAVDNNWATMPAGYITPGFPFNEIKIAPWHWLLPPGPISPENNQMVIDSVKDAFLSGLNFINLPGLNRGLEAAPLVIFHSTPSDTYYRRYTLFHFMAEAWRVYGNSLSTYNLILSSLFNGVNNNDAWSIYSTAVAPITFKPKIATKPSPSPHFYPSTVLENDNFGAANAKYQTFLVSALNGGSPANAKTSSYPIELQKRRFGVISVEKEGIPFSTQVFNFGLGDLEISQRQIGSLDVGLNDLSLSGYSPIRKEPNFLDFYPLLNDVLYAEFFTEVLSIPSKKLSNIDDPQSPIALTDLDQYNFSYFEGKPGQDYLTFNITGRLYATSGSGFQKNSCDIEMQWKLKEDQYWRDLSSIHPFNPAPGYLRIENDNTKKITLEDPLRIAIPGFSESDIFQFRIRKMTLDSVNNEGSSVCELSVDNVSFKKSIAYYLNHPEEKKTHRIGLNLEGVMVTAMANDYAQTNKYSALVKSKCWLRTFEGTWNWGNTYNPAWWFLFFARGGFLNENYDESQSFLTFPHSPTKSWVNYPGIDGNTERLFGVGLTDDKIDVEKIFEWAGFCYGSALSFSAVIRDDMSCADVLEKIANAGRASVTYVNGKLSVIYEDPNALPTGLFGMGNIIAGSFSVDYLVSDPVTKIIGRFVNGVSWETEEVSAVVPFTEDEYGKVIEVVLDGITDWIQAQREVNLLAARQFYQRRTYTWSTDHEGMIARRGDLVYLAHDATQYGFSGRIKSFSKEGSSIPSIETTSILDNSINYVTIRSPNGELNVYPCSVDGSRIIFNSPYPLSKAPFFINDTDQNPLSDFENSIPEDFVFIAGSKATPGKLVRISESIPNEDGTYTFKALDEDPAMWAYEYNGFDGNDEINPQSFNNSESVLSVTNVSHKYLGNGLVQINWECVNGDFIQIINVDTGLPIEANGSYSFSGGEVIIELIENRKYNLEIRPFSIGAPYKSISKKVVVWSK